MSSRVTNNQETNDALLKRCTSFWHMLFPANGPIDLASHIDGLAEAEGRNQDYLTILVSSHAGPLSCIFKFLLENCSPDEHIDTHHPVITWHQDALREAQEADFWMKHGSVSEIVLTGEMMKDNAGNGASASPQGHWTWRGSVTT